VRGCDGVDLVEKNDGWSELLSALKDVSDGGFGFADPLGEEGRAIDDLDVGAALASDGARKQRLPGARGPSEDDVVPKGLGAGPALGRRQSDEVAGQHRPGAYRRRHRLSLPASGDVLREGRYGAAKANQDIAIARRHFDAALHLLTSAHASDAAPEPPRLPLAG
jgi:hypothetical protein